MMLTIRFILLLILILAVTACDILAPEEPIAVQLSPSAPVLSVPTLTPLVIAPGEVATAPGMPVDPLSTATTPPVAPPPATLPPEATPVATAVPAPAFPNYLTTPPLREASPNREIVVNGGTKSYPPGAYEFIHTQFNVPEPPGRVLPEYVVAALPAVPEGACPLTGEQGSADIATRRPINVRIDNSADGRPQAGLENADVIWETLAEGGVTRFTATFHCRTPGTLGPVRSARLIDLQLTPMLEAWLVHVGASQPVTDMIWASPFGDRSLNEWAGTPVFYRIQNAPLGWLSTYTNNELLQAYITQQPNAAMPTPLRGWLFNVTPAPATGSATSISIPYYAGSGSVVNYSYNPGTGDYLRYQGQSPHTMQGGGQLAPENVIVIYSPLTITPIVEDSLGAQSLHFTLQGTGRALLFRDGLVYDARWIREGENTLIRVVDADNQVIPLKPGQTIVQIVADDLAVTWQ